jgi:hypothetical protein
MRSTKLVMLRKAERFELWVYSNLNILKRAKNITYTAESAVIEPRIRRTICNHSSQA